MLTFSRLPLHWLSKLLIAGLFVGSALAARAQDSTLTRLIRQNRYSLTVNGTQFSGAGWDKLRASVQKSQFVLLGEDHGLAEVPQFAAAIAQVLKPAVFVAEIDPYVAQEVTRLVAQPGSATAYLRRYPEALCFFDLAEEYELVRTLRAQQVQLVGIDQVFCTTSAPFYTRLAELVKDKKTKAYLQHQAKVYEAQNQQYEKLGEDDYVMTTQPQSAVDSLLLLTKLEGPVAQKMVQDYAASYTIYKTQAHQARVNLMKQNLLQALRPYQTPAGLVAPKMLFKFGSNHLARGLSQSVKGEFYDVGNLVQNLADAAGQRSLHLYIIGRQGQQAELDNPYFPARRVGKYAIENAGLQAFVEQVVGPEWAVIDLRPARRAITAGKLLVNQFMQRSILGYDYLIVIPETTASRAM
jgi:hypothetical protein